jgi:PD-(D/E)XK nuclease superfamily protein
MISTVETTPLAGPHRRERAVNRRVQGDIGELSAMEWLASREATVWVPANHSPHVDLMAEWTDRLIKVQVKTSTYRGQPKAGGDRWKVSICTNGGNRSWTGLTKKFDPVKVDHLFVLAGDGRRWFISAGYVEAAREVTLGGRKYSEFEIERGTPFEALIYGDAAANRIANDSPLPGECQSGQMDVTVNHTAMPTQVRILPPPSSGSRQVLLRPKRQMTIPKSPCEDAGLVAGERLRVHADGPGRIVLERTDSEEDRAAEEQAPI